MKTLCKDIYEYIDKSKITLIAHDFISETKVSEILSNVSSYTDLNHVPYNFTQFNREFKLSRLLNKEISSHIVFDLGPGISNNTFDRDKIDKIINFTNIVDIPVIMLTRAYLNSAKTEYICGKRPIYASNLVIEIINNNINIVKNRYE